VVSLGVATRCEEDGQDNVLLPVLERMGYKPQRAKTNIGLGRVVLDKPAEAGVQVAVGANEKGA
jgi:hypothetical protein